MFLDIGLKLPVFSTTDFLGPRSIRFVFLDIGLKLRVFSTTDFFGQYRTPPFADYHPKKIPLYEQAMTCSLHINSTINFKTSFSIITHNYPNF